jgi:hypothetical protein
MKGIAMEETDKTLLEKAGFDADRDDTEEGSDINKHLLKAIRGEPIGKFWEPGEPPLTLRAWAEANAYAAARNALRELRPGIVYWEGKVFLVISCDWDEAADATDMPKMYELTKIVDRAIFNHEDAPDEIDSIAATFEKAAALCKARAAELRTGSAPRTWE